MGNGRRVLRQRQQRGCGETAAPRQGEGIIVVVPTGVKVHLALGHADMRNRLDGLATLIQEHLKKDPSSGSSVRLPRQERLAPEDPVLGWDLTLSVHHAHGPRTVDVVAHGRARRVGDTVADPQPCPSLDNS